MIIANRGGHTKGCTGASGFIDELTEDRKVIARVNELLKEFNTIVNCQPGENEGYGEWNIGVNICNNSAAEIFFSIHFNAGGGKGSECVKHSTDSNIIPYANRVLNNLATLGFINRGIKVNDELAETKNIKCPSMVIEVCFVDTKGDVDLYNSLGVEKIARAIANGIDPRISLEEVKKVKGIVLYCNDVDRRAAEYLADALGLPTMKNDVTFDFSTIDRNGIYAVGNDVSKYTSYLLPQNLLTGSDRYETVKAVLKRIGRL